MKILLYLFLTLISVQSYADANDDLWTALLNLDSQGVKTALAAGAEVNKAHATWGVPLNYAASFGNAEMIQALLDSKATVDAEHPTHKTTPLISAITWANVDGVRILLKAGANPSKTLVAGNTMTTAFMTGNGEIVKMLLDAKVDVKKPIPGVGGDTPVVIYFVLMFKTPAERMEYIESVKPYLEKAGITKLPEFVTSPSPESFTPASEVLKKLSAAGMDLNGVQSVPGTKIKKSALALAIEMDKTEIADGLIASGCDKNGPGVKDAIAIAKANAKPNAFTEASTKGKVAYDFPREGRNGDGGGYSANLSLLKSKPTRVALVSYYLYDAGSGKTQGGAFAGQATTTAWRTADFTGQLQVNGFYDKSINVLIESFKAGGITLLTPDQFLDSDEKKEFYYGFNQESAKREKTETSMWGKLGTVVEISSLKVAPSGKGYRPFFVANESMDKSSISLFQGGVFSANRKLTSSLGSELCKGLGVDAVLVVYIATRKEKMYGGGYGVNAVVSVMLGPNPGRAEKTDPEAKNLGQFYCGTRTFFTDPVEFQGEKTKPQFDGMATILAAHGAKICAYINGKERD